jgi:hypothetical protein
MKNNDTKLQMAKHGTVTERKLVPNIPLPFDEVMGDVLRMKPPEREQPKKAPRSGRKRPAKGSG